MHRVEYLGRYAQGDYEREDQNLGVENLCTSPSPGGEGCPNLPLEPGPLLRRSWIDASYTNDQGFPRVRNGVKMGEGDGTVSLLSLGAMCVEGWKAGRRWNPGGIKVVTVEVRG